MYILKFYSGSLISSKSNFVFNFGFLIVAKENFFFLSSRTLGSMSIS